MIAVGPAGCNPKRLVPVLVRNILSPAGIENHLRDIAATPCRGVRERGTATVILTVDINPTANKLSRDVDRNIFHRGRVKEALTLDVCKVDIYGVQDADQTSDVTAIDVVERSSHSFCYLPSKM